MSSRSLITHCPCEPLPFFARRETAAISDELAIAVCRSRELRRSRQPGALIELIGRLRTAASSIPLTRPSHETMRVVNTVFSRRIYVGPVNQTVTLRESLIDSCSLRSLLLFGHLGSLLFGGSLPAFLSHVPFNLGARDNVAAVIMNWRQVAVVNHCDDPRRLHALDLRRPLHRDEFLEVHCPHSPRYLVFLRKTLELFEPM